MEPIDWSKEYGAAAFGDVRLSRRVVALAERVAQKPDASLPTLLSEPELTAAYRFFRNEKVTRDAILQPHVAATRARIGGQPCLAVHDSTGFSYRPNGLRAGLTRNHAGNQVFFAHVTLAVDCARRPLGVLGVRTHVGKAATADRERWGEQIQALDRLGFAHGQLIHVMDREADGYELLSLLEARGERYVVRVQYDRALAGAPPRAHLWDALPTQVVATRTVPLSPRSGTRRGPKAERIHPVRAGRSAKLAVGATRVVLNRPKGRTGFETLAVNVVRVWELDTPAGEAPVEWVLFTSEPIATAEELLRVVDWYRARWTIEEYFKVLKTGCAYERRQLESRHALENALALFLPVAWQLLRLRTSARESPTAPAAEVLSAAQLEVLRRVARKPLPEAPTRQDVMYAIAGLGGHLPRNGEPGWQTLWRGYEELVTLTTGWNLALHLLPHLDL
jgi:hypothetical protein